MSLRSSAIHFCQRVRQDGLRCIPAVVHARWMGLMHRKYQRREDALRAADDALYQRWIAVDAADFPADEHRIPHGEEAPSASGLTLSFLIPAYNTRPEWLNELADSLLRQTCPRWEACFCDDASPSLESRDALAALPARDPRFRVRFCKENRGIAETTNEALAMATGEIVALCDHDDLLAPDAVRCILEAADGGADFIYTDEDKVSEDGTFFYEPHCKPDFAPDSLRAGNYICHLTAMTRALMRSVGGLRGEYDGSQDHDLALRATERARCIVHIPRILYHWRMVGGSFSHQRAEKCAAAAAAAVQDHLRRLGLPARVTSEELRVRIRYQVPETTVTLIAVGSGTLPDGCADVLRVDSWQQVSDAARRARGRYLLFLHPGMTPMDPDWLNEMLMYAARPDVGCVGSAILDRKRFYRHAGYAVDVPGGAVTHHAGQWLYGRPYMITDRIVRNVTGVSSALLLIRRDLFLQLDGFGPYESDLRGADLGLRCLEAGLVNVYTPHARMLCPGLPDARPSAPCLTGPAPERDLQLLAIRFPDGVRERYYSPLFRQDGSMRVRMTP